MIGSTLNLDYLETFRAVALHGSMHRAAEERHMTQPAVTRQMAMLSREVGAPLFARFGRGVRLTKAGEVLLRESEEIVRQVGEALRRVREADGLTRDRLVLGCSHYVASNGLAAPLRAFGRRSPGVGVTLVLGSSEAIAGKVRQGEVDMAVATLPVRGEGLRSERLWRDTFAGATPAEPEEVRRNAGRPLPALSLESLASSPLILPPAGSATRELIDRAFRKKRLRPAQVTELETLESIAAAVEMGLGFSILPEKLLSSVPGRYPAIAVRPVEGFGEFREIGILLRKGRDLRPQEELLREILTESLGERS